MGKTIRLIASMFRVGLIGFGGGNALIPILERIAVTEQKRVTQEEYEEDVVVASITPGALPVEIAGGIGRRCLGHHGLLIGSASLAMPGVILTLALASAITILDEAVLLQIRFLSIGITAFICSLLTEYLLDTVKLCRSGRLPVQAYPAAVVIFSLTCGKNLYRILRIEASPLFALATIDVFIAVFFLLLFLGNQPTTGKRVVGWMVSFFYVLSKSKITGSLLPGADRVVTAGMFFLAVYGLIKSKIRIPPFDWERAHNTGKEVSWIILCVVLTVIPAALISEQSFLYIRNGTISSLLSFGGGDAYLTVADGLFVQTGLIEEGDFYNYLVPIVNIIPGSILCKTLSGIGYFMGYAIHGSFAEGIAVALAGFFVSLLASCTVFDLIGCLYGNYRNLYFIHGIRRWIRPIVSGLMLTVMLSLVFQNVKLGRECSAGIIPVSLMVLLYGMSLFLRYALKMKNGNIVFLSAMVSFAVCNLTII